MIPAEVDNTNWQSIPCHIADILRHSEFVVPYSSLTDLSGKYGHPTVYTFWVTKTAETPVLKEWRWPSAVDGEPDLRPCEHYVPTTSGYLHEIN